MTIPEENSDDPKDEDEWYYLLGKRNAQKQDAPFSGWTSLIFLTGAATIPLIAIGILLALGAGLGAAVGFVVLLIAFNILLLIFTVLFGTLAVSSMIETIRRIFKPRH